jgi:serine/threonine-protein kinase
VYVALSPDGRRIVYRGYTSTGESQLYERPLDATGSSPWTGPAVEARPIPGSEDARNLALSPDGLSVAFTSGFSLMTLSLLGGPPVSLGAQINPLGSRAGIDWAEDGFIYFNGPQGTISRIPAGGGSPEVIARPDSGSSGYGLVDVLPGGRGFVVALTSGGPSQNRQIAVMSESGGNVKILFPGVMARYATSGHLVYVTADNTLMAVPFDIRRLEVTGEAVALIEGVVVNAGTQPTQFALSESGTLVYLDGGIGRLSQVVLVTRGGTATPVDPGWAPAPIFSLALSPDETRLAVSISSSSLSADVPQDIWVKQLDRGPLPKLTFDARFNVRPSWTPDSRSLSFVSARSGVRGPPGRDIWIARADGSGEPKVLASLERSIYGATWSNDGQWLVAQVGGFGASDIVAWRVGADSVPGVGRTFSEADMVSIVASPADEYAPALSPDGRLLAYVSDEAGQVEVFVSPFPNARDWKMQVSIGGGGPPVWARSGLELFYHAGPEDVTAINSSMVAVPVANAQAFLRGEPEVLFATDGYVGPGVFPHYAVTRDGQFIIARYVDVATPVRINVVLNFLQELKVRVGG